MEMLKTEWYAGVVTALTSISHIDPEERGGQGIKTYFRREKFIQPDGRVEHVPVISGNEMRGMLRDRGMWQMCRSLGYGVGPDGEITGLSLPAFYFLFSGGSLTSTASRALDIAEARRVRDLIPLVGVFGGAMGNQIMEGKLKCGKLIPICQETAHLLPDWCLPDKPISFYDYVQEETFTRKDDEKNERLRQLIAPDVRGLLEDKRVAAKSKDKNEPDGDVGTHQQMRYTMETLAAGTTFYWELALEDVTDVEYDAFWSTMAAFGQMPFIGGKSGTGHGKVAIDFRDWVCINPNLAHTEKLPGLPIGEAYAQHLKTHGDEIREMLASWT